jgi:CRP-like cAMP-binding protein
MKPTATSSTLAEFSARFPQLAQELGPANLGMLLDGASIQEVAPERTIIRDRMPVDCIYFVLDGTLDVYIELAGNSRKIATIKPGEWIGEISVLSGEFLASATIITNTPCKLVKVHHITFGKLITENETLAKVLLNHFIALMAQRFRAPLTQA